MQCHDVVMRCCIYAMGPLEYKHASLSCTMQSNTNTKHFAGLRMPLIHISKLIYQKCVRVLVAQIYGLVSKLATAGRLFK